MATRSAVAPRNNNNYINLSECLLPGPRTELPGPVPGQARVWLRHWHGELEACYILSLAIVDSWCR